MCLLRQSNVLTEYDPKPGIAIASLAYEYPRGFDVSEHAHGSDQLIYASSGILEVFDDRSTWLIPPHFALWIPAKRFHRIHMPVPVSMRTLYLRTGLTTRVASGCAVLHMTPLLEELILETLRVRQLRVRNRYECALRDLLITQLENASPLPMFVKLPQDPRALRVAQAVLCNLAVPKTMLTLCAEAGVSSRTIERLFAKELGVNFESWRRQVRLTRAVELLVSGCSIKQTSYEVGYCQPSTFVEMFRQVFGKTPKKWMSELKSSARPSPAV